jgi:hypothetical protein
MKALTLPYGSQSSKDLKKVKVVSRNQVPEEITFFL